MQLAHNGSQLLLSCDREFTRTSDPKSQQTQNSVRGFSHSGTQTCSAQRPSVACELLPPANFLECSPSNSSYIECHDQLRATANVHNSAEQGFLVDFDGIAGTTCNAVQSPHAHFDGIARTKCDVVHGVLADSDGITGRNHHTPGSILAYDDVDLNALASALKGYAKATALCDGRRVHAFICQHGCDCSTFLGNCLIQMYGDCKSVAEAQSTFNRLSQPNLFSWNLLIQAYVQNGDLHTVKMVFNTMPHHDVISWTAVIRAFTLNDHGKEAVHLFYEMQLAGVEPNKVTFICTLDACQSHEALDDGHKIHAAIVDSGYEVDAMMGTALITMYGKCGSPHSSRRVFSTLLRKDVVAWNAMIAACAQNDHSKEALDIYLQMQLEGINPDKFTFVSILDACTVQTALEEGKSIHAAIINAPCKNDVAVNNALITMYGKCNCLDEARKVFGEMDQWDIISWGAIIAACTQNRHGDEALELFHQMQHDGFNPSNITFVCMLDECTSLTRGNKIHTFIIKFGYDKDVLVGNALVELYGKFQNVDEAEAVFNKMSQRDVVSWNTLIYHKGHVKETLELFYSMQSEGVSPDRMTFICIVDTCASLGDLENGEKCYVAIKNSHYQHDVVIGNALITMYGKCGSLDKARSIFERMPYHGIVSWNAMITACAQNENSNEALELFYQMQQHGMKPDKITFICTLNGCAVARFLDEGRKVHATIVDHGYEQNEEIGNALVSMYGKCGNLEDSRIVFSRLPQRKVVSWNAMLTACGQNGEGGQALALFHQMQNEHVDPDEITFLCALDACASIVSLSDGEEIHKTITDSGRGIDTVLGNALINMYGKCGSLSKAMSVLRNMLHRDVVSWSSLIAVCAQNGQGNEALSLFHQMQLDGVKPNDISFTCALTACSQVGCIDSGQWYFASISKDYGMTPTLEHYVCMIDLLGRAGHLDEAEDLISKMPFEKVPIIWLSFLGACRIHGDVERAVLAAKKCLELDPSNAAPYVMLANIYALAGMQDDTAQAREALEKNLKSHHEHVEVTNIVQAFIAGSLIPP